MVVQSEMMFVCISFLFPLRAKCSAKRRVTLSPVKWQQQCKENLALPQLFNGQV